MRVFYENCPLCEANNWRTFTEGDTRNHHSYSPELPANLAWLQCLACGHEFTESYWTQEALDIIFKFTRDDQTPLKDFWKSREYSAHMIERLNNKWIGSWLDIGAGSGMLMMTAQEYGYKTFGTEIRDSTLAQLRAIGLSVSKKIPLGHYNVISACDVLEHIPFPREALIEWRLYADSGAKLLISCPNKDSPLWSLLSTNPYYYELEHHHNFGFRRLTELLYETGWGKVQYGVSQRYLLGMELIAEAL